MENTGVLKIDAAAIDRIRGRVDRGMSKTKACKTEGVASADITNIDSRPEDSVNFSRMLIGLNEGTLVPGEYDNNFIRVLNTLYDRSIGTTSSVMSKYCLDGMDVGRVLGSLHSHEFVLRKSKGRPSSYYITEKGREVVEVLQKHVEDYFNEHGWN